MCLQAHRFRGVKVPFGCDCKPVTDSNCVVVIQGGKQLEVKHQSAGYECDSALRFGEPAS